MLLVPQNPLWTPIACRDSTCVWFRSCNFFVTSKSAVGKSHLMKLISTWNLIVSFQCSSHNPLGFFFCFYFCYWSCWTCCIRLRYCAVCSRSCCWVQYLSHCFACLSWKMFLVYLIMTCPADSFDSIFWKGQCCSLQFGNQTMLGWGLYSLAL